MCVLLCFGTNKNIIDAGAVQVSERGGYLPGPRARAREASQGVARWDGKRINVILYNVIGVPCIKC